MKHIIILICLFLIGCAHQRSNKYSSDWDLEMTYNSHCSMPDFKYETGKAVMFGTDIVIPESKIVKVKLHSSSNKKVGIIWADDKLIYEFNPVKKK